MTTGPITTRPAPPLRTFGVREFLRLLVIGAVLVFYQVLAVGKWALAPRRGWPLHASEGVVDAFFVLGPTFVKVGQLMGSSPGLFPKVLADTCLRCLDEVPPYPGAQARATIESDLGRPTAELFSRFDDVPLSSASVAQVHLCVLRDGREVIMKVQRRGIYHRMKVDLRIAYIFARALEKFIVFFKTANASAIIVDLHAATFAELDSVVEARRQARFRESISAFGDNEYVTAPEVFTEYCGSRVICMERMHGSPLDQCTPGDASELVVRRAAKVWMEALVLHGLFHGDVHAGNVWVLDDGRVSFLDFGVMGELDEQWRMLLQDLFHATVVDGDFTRLAGSVKRLGIVTDDVGTDAEVGLILQAVFAPMLSDTLAHFSLTDFIKALVGMGKQYRTSSPEELILVGKQLGYFERYAIELAPNWALGTDPFVFKNVFPAEIAALSTARGVELPD
ncbi:MULTISPECIES: ABC1 kinase family protein [Nocardiaceae]|uniref:ABC1 kinase family protein n=1 Tax=Nocardiaceae TaxID=85025 RepID=UPI00037FAD70|nr:MULTISPECIES: AarF/UbiB family protein [Rhodococcus]OZC52172.1 ubiquinone biosynthesis protein [Rhodococcus sp. 06-621-2]OZD10024.1 ubiquinone biosynthesis protein [Rhodococcus sp. 06-156-4C]OZD21931.1 ubiquinone biosynthesis protein [Rhodococcus sp. 06-156-3C]OZD24186.1 ubiquinone biosynthesis protein [Rhodococcus sp. 06-156-4a]OZD29341.1 ubiquinone biosynthesis protein [Rhodococcus sp. 06-156-3b]